MDKERRFNLSDKGAGTEMIPEAIQVLSVESAKRFRSVRSTPQPVRLQRGQVWSTKSLLQLSDGDLFETEEPRLVVLLDGFNKDGEVFEQVATAPISMDVSMASDFDLIIPQDHSPLGFEFMVEVWNEVPVLISHLKQFLGNLSQASLEVLQALYSAQLLGEQISAQFEPWVGPKIMELDDPRLSFQEIEVEAVTYLAHATVTALAQLEKRSATAAHLIVPTQRLLIPNSPPSWTQLLKRLGEIGVPKDFVLKRLVLPEIRSQLESPTIMQEGEQAITLQIAEVISRVFKLDPADLFSTAPLQLDTAYGTPRFKKSKRVNQERATAYTFYAHYLALLVLQATPHLVQKPLPIGAQEVHEAVNQEFGSITFENVLRYIWSRGVPVLPLSDPGNFHGACWRENHRNIIVVKRRFDYEAYWLFDTLHELRHAAEAPTQPELGVIDLAFDRQWLEREEEQSANRFAGNIMLEGRAETLVQQCVQQAGRNERYLKAAVQRVAAAEKVREDALANYLAYRLTIEGNDSWWPTAATLQVTTGFPLAMARTVLREHLELDLLNEVDRALLLQALER